MNCIIIIAGPTGSGKTDIAALIAEELDSFIISCDSVQIYKDFDVGSNKKKTLIVNGKPIKQEMIDLCNWKCQFTSFDFYEITSKIIKSAINLNKVPVIAGGTGLYMDTILYGKSESSKISKDEIEEISKKYNFSNNEQSYNHLKNIDPLYASIIHKNDKYRVLRAIASIEFKKKSLLEGEAQRLTNKIMVPQIKLNFFKKSWDHCKFLLLHLYMPRELISKNLDIRCIKMITEGNFLDEIINLDKIGALNLKYIPAKAIGYKNAINMLFKIKNQILNFKFNNMPYENYDLIFKEFIFKFQADSRAYARKQIQWYKKRPSFYWINVAEFKNSNEIFQFIKKNAYIYLNGKFNIQISPELLNHHHKTLKIANSTDNEKIMRNYIPSFYELSTFENRLPYLQILKNYLEIQKQN